MTSVENENIPMPLGAISERLSKISPRRRRYPRLAFVLTLLAVGLIVNTARQHPGGQHEDTWDNPEFETMRIERDSPLQPLLAVGQVEADRHSPATSIEEPWGAFDAEEHADASETGRVADNPTALPDVTTAPVAYHSPADLTRRHGTTELPQTIQPLNPEQDSESALSTTVPRHFADESSAVANALETYNRSLAALLQPPVNKPKARRYYAALAELAEASWQHNSEAAQEQFAQIYEHPELLKLISAAAPSWLHWSKRPSNGIVVAGEIQAVTQQDHGFVITIRAHDRQSSELQVLVEEFSGPANTTGSTLFYGLMSQPDAAGTAKIHAKMAPDISQGT